LTQYVTLSSDTTTVTGWFACPQYPSPANYAILTDSDARYTSWLNAQSLASEIETLLMSGVQIISTGTSSLNGTYAIYNASQQNITAISSGIAAKNRVPGGGSTFNYPDTMGVMHAFSATNFLNFASAIEDYVYNLSQGIIGSQPVTIA
jgi:hypothetical protein